MKNNIELEQQNNSQHSRKTDLRRTKTQKPQKKTGAEEEETILFRELFRFATKSDWAYIILGSIFSAINGVAMPLFCLIWGDVMDDFTPANGYDALIDAAAKVSIKLIVVGAGSFIASYLGFALWMITGERQAIEIRKRYFKAFLTQEISFFDSINPNELSTKMAEECFNIQGGIGEKVSTFIYAISMMIVAFIIGFVKGWQLALVLTGFLPVMIITGSLFVFVIQRAAQINNQAYSKAGAIAEEALNAIKTVVSLGGQAKELKKYKLALEDNKRAVMKFIIFGGLAIGAMMMSVFLLYALGFFIGSIFIADEVISPESGDPYTAGDVFVIFFCILNASSTLGQVSPALKAFSAAKIAATKVFKIIDKKSKISIEDPSGLKPSRIDGDIHFRNVSFAYPLKPDRKILNEISFDIRKNEKTAFVGESGCGKTTCMQLIERFYDIDSGSIALDNSELKELNLKWMRENIGYVGQEPVLFATSIKENILMAKEDASDDEIWAALKKANAYDFVKSLPKKLDTFVGTNGAQLSGGQKQRLAIARAILKDPKILLLDEATSALDRKNEMEIQKTLDEISEGRTTIVIAHRLATVQNSDHIIVFDQGKVVEEGRHEELIAKKGKYYSLQHLQLQTEEQEAQQETHTETETLKPVKINPKATLPIDKTERSPEKIEVTVHNGETNTTVNKQKDKKDAETKKIEKEVLKRLFKYNKGQMSLMIVSFIVASANGCIFPVLALLNSTMVDIFTNPDAPDFRTRSNTMSLVYLLIAIAAFLINGAQSMLFNILGENLSRKVRTEVFEKYIKMPIGWFDKPENSPGALCSKLSTDATLINTLTSSVIGYIIQALAAFICGMIISFTASWQLTLISLGLSPLMILAGKMQSKFSQGFSAQNDEAFKESAAFVAEAMNNMRTVASFGREQKIMENYSKKLDGPLKASLKRGHLSGFFFGVSQLVFFGIYAITLYLGAIFMRDIGLDLQSMLQSIFGVMFAAMGVGNAMQFIPDLGSAINAATGVFKILDTKPEINIDDPHQNVKTPVLGNIEFRNVSFKYPSREKQIFSNLSFKINASTKVAFVGPSGCGKSTILSLLQRFYDPSEGQILIDGVDIKKYDLKYLRSSFGVVSQEPVLFNGSIEYNIRYARDEASFEEVKQAATKANALKFIENNEFDIVGSDIDAINKNGTDFQRKVGPKGGQLSGGQKQRIAIARAILTNPSILILDEATSALDTQNEKEVQESLDKIMEGKTSVIVAHRISTIRDADEILVFNEGEIAERGNYDQLMKMQGMFYKLERGIDLGAK